MALNKEIWVNDIQQQLLPDNSFLTKGTDYSAFADAKTIHIPIEANSVNVEMDRAELPGIVNVSNDTEQSILMHHFTADPQRLFNPSDVELSYDKRTVYVRKIANGINQKIATHAIDAMNTAAESITGDTMRAKLLAVAKAMDLQDYPEQGRNVLLDAERYSQLLNELSEAQSIALNSLADAAKGIVGQFLGLNIFKRSTIKPTVGLLAWHDSAYKFALSPVEAYSNENDPTYYGTILSASVRFGCHIAKAWKYAFSTVEQG